MNTPNMEAPGEVGTEGRAQGTTDRPACAAPNAAQSRACANAEVALTSESELANAETVLTSERKRFATLAAHAAMSGYALHRLDAGKFLLCRWGRTRELTGLGEVERALAQAGVRL